MTDMQPSINLLVCGDFAPVGRMNSLIEESRYDHIFNELHQEIKTADIAVVNLEAPLIDTGVPHRKTGPTLKGGMKCAEALAFADFDLVTLANNHIMDYGEAGLRDTLRSLDQHGIAHIGAGINSAEAAKPFFFEKGGLRVAIVNFAEHEWSASEAGIPGANPIDPTSDLRMIQEVREHANKVIVITHGGHEMYELPSPRMKSLLRFYVDAGADAVINHHPHVVSGYEVYAGAPIFFSVGNFVFDRAGNYHSPWNKGIAVRLVLTNDEVMFDILHFDHSNSQLGVALCSTEESLQRDKKLQQLNAIIADEHELAHSFEIFTKGSERLYLAYIEPHKNRYLQYLQNRKIIPSLWSRRKIEYLLNLIRCESHRELLEKILSITIGR